MKGFGNVNIIFNFAVETIKHQITMFDKDFYPTPDSVIQRMIGMSDIQDKVILEPSAGSGNIVDYLYANGAKEVLTCEKHPKLAEIIKGKSRFLQPDFMKLGTSDISHIDFIVMNPPFSADEHHILHAYEIAPPGCEVIALCNTETLGEYHNNRYKRSLRGFVQQFGIKTQLGQVFATAERKTNVDVSLIHLYKPKADGENEFDGYFDEFDSDIDSGNSGVMSYSKVRDLVNRCKGAVELYDQVQENAIKMGALISPLGGGQNLTFTLTVDARQSNRATFKKELQKKAWEKVFGILDMRKYVTQTLMDKLNKFVEQQVNVPFTVSNVQKMLQMVVGTHDGRMNDVLIEVFDKVTDHHAENRHNVEGWVTNEKYFVGRKFILPGVFSVSWGGRGLESNSWGGHKEDLLNDFQKALCNMEGKKYDIERLWSWTRNVDSGADNDYSNKKYVQPNVWYDWGYFEIKGFKKGTAHVKFKDEKVWEQFNYAVGKAKGWGLPDRTGESKKNRANDKKHGVEIY